MNQAKIVGEMPASQATQENIMSCIVGVSGESSSSESVGSEG